MAAIIPLKTVKKKTKQTNKQKNRKTQASPVVDLGATYFG